MKKHYMPTASGLLALSLVLGGCGGSKSVSTMQDHIAAETTAASYAMAAPSGGSYDYGEEFYEYDGNDYEYGAYEETAASVPLTDTSSIAQSPLANRKLIRNVSMAVETDSFDQLLEEIQKKVTELSGYTEQSDISGNRSDYQSRYAWLTVRIPCDRLDQFIGLVEDSGNVTRKSESIQDITLQYSDIESRKKTLTMEQERIWALLEKADTLEAVIALEERLSEIRYALESMESQLKLYDNQVDYSTVDMSISEVLPVNFTPTAPETVGQRIKKGLSRNVANMGQFATDLFVGLIVLMPVWIPLGAIAALIIFLVKKKAGAAPSRRIRLPGKAAPAKNTSDPGTSGAQAPVTPSSDTETAGKQD